jgi:hypothetical protein
MAQYLASDDANPDFSGASNPDSRLAVQFYKGKVQNNFETEMKGRPIFMDMDFVRIFVPGDKNNVIDTIARDDHKQRFPVQWARYQNANISRQDQIGTPVEQWPQVTPAQAEELRALKFYTVENIAMASDANINKIGMIAGMSGYSFREKAQKFLQVAEKVEANNEAEAKFKAAEAKNEELSLQIQELTRKMSEMQQAFMSQPLEPKKRGRKPKAREGQVDEHDTATTDTSSIE